MENAKQNKAQELTAQELADVAGGVYKPSGEGSYSTDGLYNNIVDDVAEALGDSGLSYPGRKKGEYSDTYYTTEKRESSEP